MYKIRYLLSLSLLFRNEVYTFKGENKSKKNKYSRRRVREVNPTSLLYYKYSRHLLIYNPDATCNNNNDRNSDRDRWRNLLQGTCGRDYVY